jgi:DNA-binding HxlR family transcriptional regulator
MMTVITRSRKAMATKGFVEPEGPIDGVLADDIAAAYQLAGNPWTLSIVHLVSLGVSRFAALRRSLPIATNVLSRRLKHLAEQGLVTTQRYCERPPRNDYVLTEKGRAFLPVLNAIQAWQRAHPIGGAALHEQGAWVQRRRGSRSARI